MEQAHAGEGHGLSLIHIYDEDEFDDLLGLFDGLSIVERANGYDDDIPDVITVFKGPHERCFDSREAVSYTHLDVYKRQGFLRADEQVAAPSA